MEVIHEDDPNEDTVVVASIQTSTSAKAAKVVVDDVLSAIRATDALDNKKCLAAVSLSTETDIREVKEGATGDVSESRSGVNLAELLPDAASSGVPEPGILLSDGTRWVMDGHWRTRVARIANEYADKPDIARQIMGVESDTIAKHIRAALAKKGVSI